MEMKNTNKKKNLLKRLGRRDVTLGDDGIETADAEELLLDQEELLGDR